MLPKDDNGWKDGDHIGNLFNEFYLNDAMNAIYDVAANMKNIKLLKRFIKDLELTGSNEIELQSNLFGGQLSTKDKMTLIFKEHGFFGLEKTKTLSPARQQKIITKLSDPNLSMQFKIAFIHYLGFVDYLLENCFRRMQLYRQLALWFDSGVKNGENVRHMISSISDHTKVNYNIQSDIRNAAKVYNQILEDPSIE